MDITPGHPVALNILGINASLLGSHGAAISYSEQAYATDRTFEPARRNLAKARGKSASTSCSHPGARNEPRFLLIKARGYGFWSDVSHVLGALLLAVMTGRIPVTYWGYNSRFTEGSGRDAFELYFKPVSEFAIETYLFWKPPVSSRQNGR